MYCHRQEMSGMRNYVYKTRLSAERQKELFWFCRQYSRFKGELHSADSATRKRAQRNLRELDFCFLAIGSRDDLSGSTIKALRENVCDGIGYDRMRDRPPCGKNQFYKLRKEFYELLDERMKQGNT